MRSYRLPRVPLPEDECADTPECTCDDCQSQRAADDWADAYFDID